MSSNQVHKPTKSINNGKELKNMTDQVSELQECNIDLQIKLDVL